MRTTVNLDDELHALLRRRARERRISFADAVNEALREGLLPRAEAPRVTWPTHSLGASLTPRELKQALREIEQAHDSAKL